MLISAEIVVIGYMYTIYSEIVLIYGDCQRNARAVARVYSERFSRDRHLTRETITHALHRPRETGSIATRPRTKRRVSCNVPVTSGEVLAFAFLNPQVSTRHVDTRVSVSKCFICIWYTSKPSDTGANIDNGRPRTTI